MAVHPLGESDAAWVQGMLERVTALARTHGDPATSKQPSLAALDSMWAEAILTVTDDIGANAIINLVGVGVGQYLVSELALEWSVVVDEFGTDLAVTGQPGNIVVTPTSLVAKRWETKAQTFVVATVGALVKDLRRMRPN